MKRIRNTFMCLLVCILAGTWIPVTKAKEALRLLVITETLDPEDQPHAAESFSFPDGKTLWYLDYTDPLQAEAAKRTYINDPLQEDTAIESEGEAYLLSDLCTALYEAIENREEIFVLNLSDEEITANPVLHDLVQRAIQNGTVIRNSLETEGTREVSSLEAELKYGASYDPQSDRWIWQPDAAAAGHRFTYRVSFSTSGLYETERDTVRIQIPLHILSTRDGNPGDDFEISAVFEEELEEEDELGWRFKDGMIEVFNNREESSGLEGYFEISYYTGYETFEYADGSTSAPFEAEMILVHGESEESQKTSAPSFTVDTKAEIVSTVKRYPVKYSFWNDAWMAKPEDTVDEEYLIWEISSRIMANTTQPYTFTLEDQVSSQQTDTRVLGYWFFGTPGFRSENFIAGQTIDQQRTDYVLTAHKRSDAERIEIDNHVTVKVKGEDGLDEESTAVSSAEWSEEKSSFHEPVGSLGSEKYGNETVFGLDLLQSGISDSLPGLNYYMVMEGYPYQWTREEGSDPLDPSSYGKVPVVYTLQDDTLQLGAEGERLEAEDYSIDSLQFEFLYEDALFNEETQSFEPTDPVYLPEDTFVIEGLLNGTWQRLGVYSLFTDTAQSYADTVEINENGIVFNAPCNGIRLTCQNAHYHMKTSMHLSVRLNNTPHVQRIIENQNQVTLLNTETFTVTQNETELYSVSRSAPDWIQAAARSSDLKKRVIASANNQKAKEYTLSWRVDMQETKSDETGFQKPWTQNGGIFWDLLPEGSTCREDSIRVVTENGTLDQDLYTYSLIPDFRHSGRNMLKVEISQPADQYQLFYDTVHSWESIRDFGSSILNPIAYETGNVDIADGSQDDGSGLSEINRNYFDNLDPSSDEPRFIYTEQPHDIAAITSAISGLTKKVSGQSGSYAYSDITAQDSLYSYRLRFETAADSYAEKMVFFDSLETFETADGLKGSWKGTLQSVDLSQLIRLGINPKVYISTVQDLDVATNHELTDTSIWSDNLSNLSAATAVAIDMSERLDGSDFVLEPSRSVTAVLYMKAPPAPLSASGKTYNNIWMSSLLSAEDSEPQEYLIHQDCTEINLCTQADIQLLKVSAAAPETPVPGISFELSGISDYGKQIHMTAVSGSKGYVRFPKIDRGTYELKETGSYEDWLCDDTIHTVRIDDYANVWIDDQNCTDTAFILTNQPRVHGAFTFIKRDSCQPAKPVSGAVYRLYGTSVYGNEIVCYGTTALDGTVTMNDIEPGTYTLKETESPPGYIKDENEYQVTLDEYGIFHVQGCETDEEGRVIFEDEPLHHLKLIKQSSYDGSKLNGAAFLLSGTADDGSEVYLTESSDQRGTVLFENLKAGTYILQEIQSPEGYVTDASLRAIRVNHDGTVKSDDLEKNDLGDFFILNQPSRTGTIRIIKHWKDDGTQERPVPTIHLVTQKPSQELKTVTIDKDLWIDEETGLAWIAEGLWFEENTEYTKEEVLALEDLIRIDDDSTDSQMYIWQDDDGWQWWSDADLIYLPEDYSSMFASCTELEELDLSRFSSENVTDMNSMFSNCFALSDLSISHFDTSSVCDMNYMFHYCKSLVTLDLTNMDTHCVENMSSMFSYCSALTMLDISSFDTSNVLRMDSMFSSCSKLTAIYVSDLWSTESVYSGRDMFKNCRKLPGFNTSKIDYTYAHTGEGGYLTLKETSSRTKLFDGLFTKVIAEEPVEYVSVSENFVRDGMSDSEKARVMNDDMGFWQIISPDTWVYTFPVIDENRDYWFYEENIEGWAGSATILTPGQIKNQTGTIINFNGVIPETGEMLITKDVVNSSGNTERFGFTVTLRNEKGEPLHGTSVYGDTPFENGVARVRIGKGETYRIVGIPAGYMYLVEEDESECYRMTSTGASGVISEDTTVVHFTNTKEEISDETVNIRLKKRITGRYEDMDEEKFTFHIYLGGLDPEKEYRLSDGQIYFADDSGGADFSYSLKGDEFVDLLDLPVGSTYQICEEGGDYLASYEITDGNQNDGIIKPYRLNDRRDHFLSTALETVCSPDDIEITFTNRFDYVQNITVQKICIMETDDEFEFTASFSGLEETDRIESELGTLVPDSGGKIVKTFYLGDRECITFRNVPVTVNYTFTEERNSWIPEYTIEDRYGRGQVVKAFGTASEAYTALTTKEETVNQFEDVLVTFTNTPVPVDLAVTKRVKGSMASRKERFSFELQLEAETEEIRYEKTKGDTLIGAGEIQRNGNGLFCFELAADQTIRFKDLIPDTPYTVTEITPSEKGYDCSIEQSTCTTAGNTVSARLSRNESENSCTFCNEKQAVIPTGTSLGLHSTAVCVLTMIAVILYSFR